MSKDLEIKVKLATDDIRKGIDVSRGLIKSLDKEKASIIIDLKKEQLQADFQKIKAEFQALNAKPVTAEIQLQKDKAIADLAGIKTQLKSLDKVKLEIEVPKNAALELKAIGDSFSAISGILTGLKNDAIASFKEFDAARVKLSTIGESGKALAGELRGLSKELGFQASSAELANGGYTALSGGFTKAGESSKILKAATVGAVGGFSDADKVTKALVATLNAYGGSADDAASFVDKFSSVQQNGIITIDEYAGQIAQLAPIAAQSGVKLDELNGFISTATASGVPASQTFSGLRQAIASTLKPSSEASKLAEKLGISFDAQALKTKGLSGILGDLNAKGADTAENLVQLFGSVEAVSAIAPSAGEGFAKLQANIAGSADSAGLAAKNFDTVANSVGGRAKALQNELNESLSQFGEKLLAVTNPVVQGTTAIVRAFNALPEPVQAAIAIFVGGGAAIAAFGAAVATIAAVAGPTVAGLTLLSGVVSGLGSVWATLNTTVALNISIEAVSARGKAVLAAATAIATQQITAQTIATALATGATNALNFALTSALVPLGLIIAGIALINVVRITKDLEELNNTLDTSAKTAQNTGNETFKLANKLKALSEARKAGNADPTKEKGFLDIANKTIEARERLKKEQEDLASKASNPNQKQAFLNVAKGYEIEANALKGQVANLEKIRNLKDQDTTATKEQTKALKDQVAEQEKIAKAKADIDTKANAKRQDLFREEGRKTQEQSVTKERDTAVDNFKVKQERELANFKIAQENKFGEIKTKGEKDIAAFKEQREAALESQKLKFTQEQENLKRAEQDKREAAADSFRQSQESADRKYQKEKEDAQRKLADELSGARTIVDRESAIGQADPQEAEKLRQKFAEEDRIRQQVASTNVDTKSTKEQFANQAKQIAGVSKIGSAEDAAKVQLALTELEAKAKAQAAEEERKKDLEFAAKKQAAEKAFSDEQKLSATEFEDAQKQAALDFETNILKPQKAAINDEIDAKKLAFEQGTLQPLKLKQEEDLAAFRQQKSAEEDQLKAGFEQKLSELRRAAKLEDIALDAQAQKTKLDTEAAFKQNQRELDLANATKIAQIISASMINTSGLSSALGTGKLPQFSKGAEIQKAVNGNQSPPASNNGGVKIDKLIVQSPDPTKDMGKILQNVSSLYGAG